MAADGQKVAPITHDTDEVTAPQGSASAAVTTAAPARPGRATRRPAGRTTGTTARPSVARQPVVLPPRRSGRSGLAVKVLLAGALAVAMVAIVQENGAPVDRGPGAEPPAVIVELD